MVRPVENTPEHEQNQSCNCEASNLHGTRRNSDLYKKTSYEIAGFPQPALVHSRYFASFVASRLALTIKDTEVTKKTYLLFHHTPTPATTTTSGRINWLVARTKLSCPRVMVIRRSSCCFGRIEIRSSSEESQFTALSARSSLPLKSRKRFAAQPELPITTNRPCEFSFPVL